MQHGKKNQLCMIYCTTTPDRWQWADNVGGIKAFNLVMEDECELIHGIADDDTFKIVDLKWKWKWKFNWENKIDATIIREKETNA